MNPLINIWECPATLPRDDAPASGFYVYVLYRPNGCPFYVGKGTGTRLTKHEWQAEKDRKANQIGCFVSNVINKYLRQGQRIGRKILFISDSEDESLSVERLVIGQIRAAGIELCNQTSGGEKGKEFDADYRRKLSAAHAGVPLSEDHRRGMSESRKRAYAEGRRVPARGMLGKKQSEHFKDRAKETWTGRKHSDETKRKVSEGLRRYYSTHHPWNYKKGESDA